MSFSPNMWNVTGYNRVYRVANGRNASSASNASNSSDVSASGASGGSGSAPKNKIHVNTDEYGNTEYIYQTDANGTKVPYLNGDYHQQSNQPEKDTGNIDNNGQSEFLYKKNGDRVLNGDYQQN